jgi:hypothetical protein
VEHIPDFVSNLESFHNIEYATKFGRFTVNLIAHVGTVFHTCQSSEMNLTSIQVQCMQNEESRVRCT